jgi:uncharacterized repeat protein (TIGR01451 family)
MRNALRICLVLLVIVLAALAQEPGPILKNPIQPPTNDARPLPTGAILKVECAAPEAVNLKKSIKVQMTVRNLGAAAAEGVGLECVLPENVRHLASDPAAQVQGGRVTWVLGELPAGSERTIHWTLEGTSEGELVVRPVVSQAAAAARVKLTQPLLAVSQLEPFGGIVGEEVGIKVEVKNPGTGPAENIVLQHRLPAGLQHPRGDYLEKDVGTLGPGERKEITLNVKAAERGRHVSRVMARADDGLEASTDAVMQIGMPALKLTGAPPQTRYINTSTTFSLELTNPGDAPARMVQVHCALPPQLRFESAEADGRFDRETGTLSWSLPSLAGGAKKSLSFHAVPTQPGELACAATARAEPRLEAHAEARLTVLGVPALLLEVVDAEDPLALGEETEYEIQVKNQGSASNTNVQIIVLLPEGLALVKVDGATPHRLQGKQVIFDPLPELKAGAETMYRLTVRGVIPGDYRTRVQLQSDQLRIPVIEEESTKVYRE